MFLSTSPHLKAQCTKPDKGVARNGATLTANETGATYQWLNCQTNKSPITGETNRSFTTNTTGRYAVAITKNNCKDTSICVLACVPNNNLSTTVTGKTITTPALAGTIFYSWKNCAGGSVLAQGTTTNSYTATQSGSYRVETVNRFGCPEFSECVAICFADKPTVIKAGTRLSVNKVVGATYQWLNCGNSNAPVMGATDTAYTPTATGNYAVEITRSTSCKDTSVCTIVCTDNKPLVTKSGAVLTTPQIGATYQWLNCGNSNAPITGATANTYTATANGSYAVEIVLGSNCKDTSVCTVVSGVGLVENTFASNVKLYPNLTTKDITVELGDSYTDLKIELVNMLGQVILIKQVNATTNKVILPIEASSGIYFLRLSAREGFASFRIVKE